MFASRQLRNSLLSVFFADFCHHAREAAARRPRQLSAESFMPLKPLPTPVIGRIHDGDLLLDLRCLDDDETFVSQLRAAPLP